MATIPQLSRLSSLDVRDVWPHEAHHFTQWLLQNADVLSDVLGMDLELTQAEKPVGGFSLDLIGKDLQSGATVIVAMGDGTAGFHFAEFETAARENTGFVAVIGNDARWNAEYAIQMREYGADRTIGCELSEAARYDRAAEAFGCDAAFATTADEVAVALEKAVASGRPTCVEARIAPVPAPQFSRTGTAAPGAH